jgi:hypothetical protein
MKFYSEKPNVVIYHPTKAKLLVRFNGHTFETNNDFIIKRLKALGYKEQHISKMTVPKLREAAKEADIEIPQGAKKADIVELLGGDLNV